ALIPARGEVARLPPAPFLRQVRELLSVAGEAALPVRLPIPAAGHRFAEPLQGLRRDEEGLLPLPAERLLGQTDLFLAERAAVSLGGPGLVRRTVAERRVDEDDRRPRFLAIRLFQRRVDRVEVGVAVLHAQDLPAVRLVPA